MVWDGPPLSLMVGGLEVWRFGGFGVWGFAGLGAWGFGGVGGVGGVGVWGFESLGGWGVLGVWGFGGLGVWGFGGLGVWGFGGLGVWGFGGLLQQWRRAALKPHEGVTCSEKDKLGAWTKAMLALVRLLIGHSTIWTHAHVVRYRCACAERAL